MPSRLLTRLALSKSGFSIRQRNSTVMLQLCLTPGVGSSPVISERGHALAYENRGAVISMLARSELPVHSEKLQSRFNPGHHKARSTGLPIAILNQIRLKLVCPNRSRMSK